MMEFKLIAVFLTLSLLNTANALECYECFDVAKCRGEQKDHVVQCSNNTAQNMVLAAGFFYPNLTAALVYNGNYQCTALQFTPQGAQNVSLMAKGCMFETKESLCKLEAKIPNGNFSCKATPLLHLFVLHALQLKLPFGIFASSLHRDSFVSNMQPLAINDTFWAPCGVNCNAVHW
uniref:Putative salivary secreted peptide n=1 Tax=Aedes albopictus TaxID=7160 RepID=A0A023EIW3_AEDAL